MSDFEVQVIPVDSVEPNKYNPNVLKGEKFEALKQDVKNGNYDPILVSPKDVFYGESVIEEKFVIVDGEHRWKAACEVGLESIRAEVQSIAIFEAKTISFKRNRERGRLDPFKEAELFNGEVRDGLTEEEVAARYGVSRSYVAGRRMLLKTSGTVRELYYKPDATLKELAREKIQESVQDHVDLWKLDMTEEEVEREVEEKLEDIVPRGTLTSGHLKAIAGLPRDYQEDIAADVLHRGLTVRDAEDRAQDARERIEEEKRFRKVLEKARQKTCPKCGATPSGFSFFNEKPYFVCSSPGCYNSWDPMVTKEELEAQKVEREKRSKEVQAERLRETRENPAYVRRLETVQQLDALIRPWILRKLNELDGIESINVVGFRGDEAVEIEYPGSYHNSLTFNVGPKEKKGDEWWRSWEREFCFSMEPKDYKTLPAKSKVDIHGKASSERRAEIHRFLDKIVSTDQDPFLPEDEGEA